MAHAHELLSEVLDFSELYGHNNVFVWRLNFSALWALKRNNIQRPGRDVIINLLLTGVTMTKHIFVTGGVTSSLERNHCCFSRPTSKARGLYMMAKS